MLGSWFGYHPWFRVSVPFLVLGSGTVPWFLVPVPFLGSWFRHRSLILSSGTVLGFWFWFCSLVLGSSTIPWFLVLVPFLGSWFWCHRWFLVPVPFLGSWLLYHSLVLGSGTIPWFYTPCSSRAGTVPICTNLTYVIPQSQLHNNNTIYHDLQYGTNIPIEVHK